tara:strand:+ start:46613 stop:47848 length:1236 start_codon:yes stop_codon:yes gene_type:complete
MTNRTLAYGTSWHISCLTLLYFSQGLSAGFLGYALVTFLTSKGSSVTEISLLLSATMLPWTLKFLLGPIIDSISIIKFGRRRFWILLCQAFIILILLPLLFIDLNKVTAFLIIILTIQNLFVAISDIATDALAADSLEEKDLGKANGFMWGSKTLGTGLGMTLATSLYFLYGFSTGLLVLISCLSIIFLFPLFSRELPYKIGMEEESVSRLGFKDLFSQIVLGLNNNNVFLALIFMTFCNIGYGIFDVLYNQFYIETLGWSGQQIGSTRPIGMWAGGLIGLCSGLLSVYFGKKYLLIFFILLQMSLFLLLSFVDMTSSSWMGSFILVSLDSVDAGWRVLIFSILMALCTTQTSATNFGIFMGLANLSTIIGNSLAPFLYDFSGYTFAFFFGFLTMIPCLFIAPILAKRISK